MKKIYFILMLATVACLLTGCKDIFAQEVSVTEYEEPESKTEATTEVETEQETEPAIDDHHVKELFYDANGELLCYMITTYNEDGKVSQRATYQPDGTFVTKIEHQFYDDGRLLMGSWYSSGSTLLMESEYYYNDEGQVTRVWQHGDSNNSVSGNMSYYYYDEEDRVSMREYYSRWTESGNHSDPVYYYYEYDENGLNTRLVGYTDIEKTEKVYTREIEYTEFGKTLKQTNYDGEGVVSGWKVCNYEGETCISVEIYNADGTLKMTIKYQR